MLPRVWRGEHWYDGGITDNTPVFHDGVRPQLVVRFLTIREGVIYYEVEEMVELVEKGIRELGRLVRENGGGGILEGGGDRNLRLLGSDERYTRVHSVVPPRFCCADPALLKLGVD